MEFSELVNQPDALVGVEDVAHALGMSRPSAAFVVASGIGGPSFQRGSHQEILSALVPADTLERLAGTPWIQEHPEALVVRVRPARVDPEDDTRPFKGWHPNATFEAACQGVGRWWRIKDPDYWHGKTLVATVVGYIAHVATIKDHDEGDGLVAFNLVEPDPAVLAAFAGKRMVITRGGATVHLQQSAGWTV